MVLFGDSYSDAYGKALALQKKSGATFVHPYDDPDVIAGQGTIGMEILRQWQAPLDAIFVAIGGGGLIGGIAAYIKRVRPDVKVIGVQPEDSDAMARSVAGGRRVTLPHVGLFADGVAVKAGRASETFRLARQYVDDVILVDTDATCAALKDVFEDTRSILEPAGALAIAGVKAWVEALHRPKDRTYVAIACGANMNFDRLRFVAERAELGEAREAILAVTIPERPGSFREFCALLGKRERHRVQLSLCRSKVRASLRRHRGRQPARDRAAPAASSRSARSSRSISPTTRWPSCTCATSSAGMRPQPSTRSSTASNFPSGRAR